VSVHEGSRHRNRVLLTAEQPTINLTRHGFGSGTLRVNLRWSAPAGAVPGMRGTEIRPRRFGLRRLEAEPINHARSIDLDLGCLYEFRTGQRGVVQSLGDRRGAYDRPPYVRLDRDDRSGSSTGENLFVNLDHAAAFSRLLMFTYIYAGAPDFGQADAVVTLHQPDGAPIEIHLDDHRPNTRSCAVALISHAGGELILRRELRYVTGYQSELDRLYRWNLRWGAGSK
jgi:tellurite resistance protein TerA